MEEEEEGGGSLTGTETLIYDSLRVLPFHLLASASASAVAALASMEQQRKDKNVLN